MIHSTLMIPKPKHILIIQNVTCHVLSVNNLSVGPCVHQRRRPRASGSPVSSASHHAGERQQRDHQL